MAYPLHYGIATTVIKPALRYFLITLALLVCGLAALSLWLLRTESGARFLWTRAVNAVPATLVAGSVTGDLHNGVLLRDVQYSDAGTRIRAGQVSFAAEPAFFGLGVTLRSLHLNNVTVQPTVTESRPAPHGEQASSRPVSDLLPSLQLPVRIRLTDLLIANASLLGADGNLVFAIDKLGFDANWDDRLAIDRLNFASGNVSVIGAASVGLAAPHTVTLAVEFRTSAADRGWLPESVNVQLGGDLQELQLTLDSRKPTLRIDGAVSDVTAESDVNLLVTTSGLSVPPGQQDASLRLNDLRLRITGSINDYNAELTTQLRSEFAAPLAATATLQGDLQSLRVRKLELASTDITATASGQLSWQDVFEASATVDVATLNPTRWIADWPEAQAVQGQADLSYRDGRLEIARLQASQAGSDASVSGKGLVDTQSGALDVEVAWQNVQWPLAPAVPAIDSRAADLRVQGTLDDWALQGEIALGAKDLPPGSFVLQGTGSRDSAMVRIEDSEVLGGRVVGEMQYRQQDGGQWSARLKTTDTQITPFLPAWPGQVSADFDASGAIRPFALQLDIRALTGEVRGREITAAGAMRLAGEQLRFDKLRLRSGNSRLQLDGDWQSVAGVSFALESSELADLLPAAAGSVTASGRLQPGKAWPLLTLDLQASDLAWQQWSADELTVRNQPVDASRPFELTLRAAGASAADFAIDTIDLTLAGAPEAHEIAAQLQRANEALQVALRGGINNPRQPDARWQGSLASLRFDGREELVLTLREAVSLAIGRDSANIARACFDINAGGELCTAGELRPAGQYNASIDMSELPLNLLRSFSATTLSFNQQLSGSLTLATGPRGRPSGSGRIDMTPGQIKNNIDERLTLRTRAGFASFELRDGQLLAGEINLPFSDAAEIAGSFRVADIRQGENSEIAGKLKVVVRDLGVGARILPQIDDAGGSLDADIGIDGTLGKPAFTGGLAIHDGFINYDPLGLSLREIQLDSKVLADNRVELTTTFSAGEGSGRITSSADYLQGRSGGFEVSLLGKNLKLIDLPDLTVVLDPDVQLGIRGDDIRINGKVVVPAARVASVAFVNTGVSESDDVVYVGPQQPANLETEETASRLNYSGSVALELGDNVVIDLDVAEARLRGKTSYRWNGDAMPMADGSFNVSGKFEAYGQLLEITEGTIRYANMPAGNPLLRIRAEREIFGNSQVRRAGVFVSGTAQRPKLEVYTNPATSPDRALTLLVTGSDFNYEQGVGAVDVGTYIAPRLYASYGIGLFDRDNVISVRYDLASGFGIKATSGKQAAGIDISYTIER